MNMFQEIAAGEDEGFQDRFERWQTILSWVAIVALFASAVGMRLYDLGLPFDRDTYALAWYIGFVSFITPSRLGFREGAIVGLFALSLPLPAGLAPIIAILSRFVSTLAELLCVGIAYLGGGRQVLPLEPPDSQGRRGSSVAVSHFKVSNIQQEQAAQPRSTNEQTTEKDMSRIPFEASWGISMTRLKLENPALLVQQSQGYIHHLTAEGKRKPPFSCDVLVVLGGNIVKSGVGFITTPYTKGTKKSFGAQGRVITAAFLYHQGVCDCIILSTGKTDPEDQDAPTEATVMKAELMAYDVPEISIYLEERSRTTEENARELARLLNTESFQEKKTIGVVTSSWHIRRTDAFLEREGVKREGRTIKYISSDTMLCRYLPAFRADMHRLYRRSEMKERIQDELNGYNALKNGTYQSRTFGEIAVKKVNHESSEQNARCS